MPRVSIIIPSYNHARFVGEAMESVIRQSYEDLELIVIDDGSTDGTSEVARSIADPRISVIACPKNRGAAVVVNEALGRAKGEYVSILSSDDFFLPGKLEKQVRFLDENQQIGAVFGLPQFVDENSKPFWNPSHPFANRFTSENRGRHEWLRHFFYSGNCLCHPTILIRRACYEAVGAFDPLLMQLPDLDLWVRLSSRYEIHILPEKLTAFRVLADEQNTSAPTQEKAARHAWETLAVLRHYASLPDQDLRTMGFGADGTSALVHLALESISIGRPGYVQFGLELLNDCIRRDPSSFPTGEYFRLVGACDPFGVRFQRFEHRLIENSSLLKFARAVRRRILGMNLGK